MKTFYEALTTTDTGRGWRVEDPGYASIKLPDGDGGFYEVAIEPLLFGQYMVAIYHDGDLIANKVPVRPGGPQVPVGGEE